MSFNRYFYLNPGTSKVSGHLGTAVMRKAETVCVLTVDEKDDKFTNVSFPLTRNFPIDDFSFTINDFGLPIIKENGWS